MTKTFILRLGHRPFRDKRVSTHVCLVARALGAQGVYYTGEHDSELEESVNKVVKAWGGPFFVEHVEGWRKLIKDFKGDTVQLTMYGLPFEKNLKKLKKDLLVIVGSSKVPPEVYQLVDYNLAVTNQPHSEIGALAVFLDHHCEKTNFKDARQIIEPSARKKLMEEK